MQEVKDSDSENMSGLNNGLNSLRDKISNGVLLYNLVSFASQNPTSLKTIISILPVVCSLIAFTLVYVFNMFNKG